VIHQGSCEGQRLANVFVLKLGVFAFEFSSIGISSQRLEHSAHRKAKVRMHGSPCSRATLVVVQSNCSTLAPPFLR